MSIPGDASGGTIVGDYSSCASLRKVLPSSVLCGAATTGESLDRDDSEMLATLAHALAERNASDAESHVQLGWIDTSFRPGDIIPRIDGRAIDLACGLVNLPRVRSVRHDFEKSLTTSLVIGG